MSADLSPREREVLERAAFGRSNGQIAAELGRHGQHREVPSREHLPQARRGQSHGCGDGLRAHGRAGRRAPGAVSADNPARRGGDAHRPVVQRRRDGAGRGARRARCAGRERARARVPGDRPPHRRHRDDGPLHGRHDRGRAGPAARAVRPRGGRRPLRLAGRGQGRRARGARQRPGRAARRARPEHGRRRSRSTSSRPRSASASTSPRRRICCSSPRSRCRCSARAACAPPACSASA